MFGRIGCAFGHGFNEGFPPHIDHLIVFQLNRIQKALHPFDFH
jgi:hypothetical protein